MKNKLLKNLNQKGIAHHLLLIILAVVAVVGAAGFFVWQRQRSNNLSADAASRCTSQPFSQGSRDPSTTDKTLQCVRHIQTLLKFHYNRNQSKLVDPGPADGIYGSQTARAVSRFQTFNGLSVDGSVGVRQTWPALCRGANNSASYSPAGCGGSSTPAPAPPSTPGKGSSPSPTPAPAPTPTVICSKTTYSYPGYENSVQDCVRLAQKMFNEYARYWQPWFVTTCRSGNTTNATYEKVIGGNCPAIAPEAVYREYFFEYAGEGPNYLPTASEDGKYGKATNTVISRDIHRNTNYNRIDSRTWYLLCGTANQIANGSSVNPLNSPSSATRSKNRQLYNDAKCSQISHAGLNEAPSRVLWFFP